MSIKKIISARRFNLIVLLAVKMFENHKNDIYDDVIYAKPYLNGI